MPSVRSVINFDRVIGVDMRESSNAKWRLMASVSWTSLQSLVLGQVISVLITGTGVFSSLLAAEGINMPVTQSSLNYVLLCGLFLSVLPKLLREGLSAPIWIYVLWAVCDVEANFIVVEAYQYTSIASVMLLDCFAIPCTMVLSCILLKGRYTPVHIGACCICFVGISLTVWSDVISRTNKSSSHGPSWVGDVMVLCGAGMYGLSNVLQEMLLKRGCTVREALGVLGVLGTILSTVQALSTERLRFEEVAWNASKVVHMLGFQLCLFGMYLLTSLFLSVADAALFNLSMLTSDIYSVAWAWAVMHHRPTWLYGAAFATTVSGLIVYHTQPSPVLADNLRIVGGSSHPSSPLLENDPEKPSDSI